MGTALKVPAPNAAHVNATMVHALDYDDVHEAAVMHPGVIAIPTAMALAERKGSLSGKELITIVALGSDIMCRLGLSTTPGRSPIEVGWHQTTLFGFMGAAAVAGRTLGLTEAASDFMPPRKSEFDPVQTFGRGFSALHNNC